MRLNTSLQKGLKILELIASTEKGAKLIDCAKACDLASSNTTLFLNTLIHCGYVIKDSQSGTYCLSDKLQDIAQLQKVDIFAQLKMIALSEMKRLHKLYNENVVLSMMSRHHLNIIQEISSTQAIRIINRPEDLFLPHVTAAGKSILAYYPPKKLKAYLRQCDFPRLTEQSLKSEEDLIQELKNVEKQGWASNIGEYDNQVYGIAAPIFSGDEVLASLIVQYPGFRHNEEQLQSYAKEVVQSAECISKELNPKD